MCVSPWTRAIDRKKRIAPVCDREWNSGVTRAPDPALGSAGARNWADGSPGGYPSSRKCRLQFSVGRTNPNRDRSRLRRLHLTRRSSRWVKCSVHLLNVRLSPEWWSSLSVLNLRDRKIWCWNKLYIYIYIIIFSILRILKKF